MLPIRPTHDSLLIDIIDRDVTQKDLGNGKVIHLLSDDTFSGAHDPMAGRHRGIRPRWARVLALGPDVHADDVQVGDLVLCDTNKWSRGFPLGRDGLQVVRIWRISVNDILMVDTNASSDAYLQEWEATLSRLDYTIGRL